MPKQLCPTLHHFYQPPKSPQNKHIKEEEVKIVELKMLVDVKISSKCRLYQYMNKTNVWNILLLARDLKRNGHEEQQANYLLFSVKKDILTEKTLGPEKRSSSHTFLPTYPRQWW